MSSGASMSSPSFLAGGGAAGALARSTAWEKTALGPVEGWPQSLKTTTATILRSRHPMFLWWGPELVQIYNDGYVPSFGRGKHPKAMGQRGRDCWEESWPIIAPQIEDVMSRGIASWNEDQLIPIFRNGRVEEVYWTYGYSPVLDDNGEIGGTLVVCTETTARVVSERRIRTLHQLAQITALATTASEVTTLTAEVLKEARSDVPFTLFYEMDKQSGDSRLVRSVGLSDAVLKVVDPLFRSWTSPRTPLISQAALPHDLAEKPVSGSGGHTITEVFIAPTSTPTASSPTGFLIFGISPKLAFDSAYQEFLTQLSQQYVLTLTRVEAFRVRAATEGERNSLLMQAPVGTAIMTGPEHVFQLANPLYRQVVGCRDLIGKSYLQAFPELAATALPGILDRVYRTGEPFVTNELMVSLDQNGDGKLEDRYFRFNLEAVRDLDGMVYGMMAIAVDITDLVKARHILERSQLEREKLLTDLEQANRTKDEFLAMLGHELRNPLSPIVTALQLMKMRNGGALSREQTVIDRQVAHLVRLVDDLLDISRITRGKVELRKESVEIAEVMSKAVEIASVLLESRQHELHIEVPPKLRWEGDSTRLAQVVANLLTNSARYTNVGGRIVLKVEPAGKDYVISVKDNGAGLSAELLPRVFDLFFQGKRSSDRAEGGLGIGLTLVKSLVLMHGGTVTAKSEGPGKGSEFIVRLPAVTPDSAFRMAKYLEPPSTGTRTSAPRRILIVDDNADAAILLSEMMRSIGHQVVTAHDPLAALGLLEDFIPEFAVLDIGLPVMDGYELAGRIQERLHALSPGLKMIALSGYGQEHDRERSHQAGFHAHLVKPVDLPRLLALISES